MMKTKKEPEMTMSTTTMTKKKTFKKFVTPPGIAHFPKLNTPDDFKGQKKFKTGILVDPNDSRVASFLQFLDVEAQRVYEECMAEAAEKGGKSKAASKTFYSHVPYEEHFDKDGNETGMVIIKATCGADYAPTLLDSQKNKIQDEVWGGSVIQVAGLLPEFGPAFGGRCGVSLRIYQVMVHELNTGSGSGGGSFDFDESDGGYVSDTPNFDNPSNGGGDHDADADADGDF